MSNFCLRHKYNLRKNSTLTLYTKIRLGKKATAQTNTPNKIYLKQLFACIHLLSLYSTNYTKYMFLQFF